MTAAAGTIPSAPRRDFSLIQLIALVFVVCTAFSSQMIMPLWIGAIIDDYGMTRSAAGEIGAMEMAVVAIISVLMAVRVHRFNARSTVMVGLAFLVFGNLLAAFMQDYYSLAFARVLVGAGKGIVVTISFSLAAGTTHPTRAFAVLNASYALFSMGFFLIGPGIIAKGGAMGAFLMLSSVAFISAFAMFWYPSRAMESQNLNLSFRDIKPYGFMAFAALIILWIGHNAIWTFVERLGLRIDLSPAQIGQVLSLAAFITIGGPSLARLLDNRFGYTAPILVATTLKIAVTLALVYVAASWVFSTAVPMFLLVALFMAPYFLGILSLADPAGRLAAAASAAMTAGSSLGALFGGWTADGFGYEGLAWVAVGNFVIVLALMALVTFRIRQSALAEPSAAQ